MERYWGLAGKAALVTGGASGIGRAIAESLGRAGARVLIADIEPATDAVDAVRAAGGTAEHVQVDLRRESDVDGMVQAAADRLGALDLFVNVAGRFYKEAVTELTSATWNDALATNATACALAARSVSRRMIERGGGAILVVGSTVVYAPAYEQAAYRASKAALRAYMETLAIELAPFGIRVNMLSPGPFPTGLVSGLPAEQREAAAREVPLGQREGVMDEIGHAALFLLSDRTASYITGADLPVDGGLHMRPLYIGPLAQVRSLNVP